MHRVVCAADIGTVVNPGIVAQQIEGGVIFALSAALHGRIDIEGGVVKQTNFPSYPVVRLAESPRVETHLVASTRSPGGVGEIAVPPLAPALANALFALTGTRLRELPLSFSAGGQRSAAPRDRPLPLGGGRGWGGSNPVNAARAAPAAQAQRRAPRARLPRRRARLARSPRRRRHRARRATS